MTKPFSEKLSWKNEEPFSTKEPLAKVHQKPKERTELSVAEEKNLFNDKKCSSKTELAVSEELIKEDFHV